MKLTRSLSLQSISNRICSFVARVDCWSSQGLGNGPRKRPSLGRSYEASAVSKYKLKLCCSCSLRFKVGTRALRGCCQAVTTRSSVPRVCCSYSLRLQVVTKALRGWCQVVTSRNSVPRVCCSYSLRLQVGQGLPFGYSHRLQVFKRPVKGCRKAAGSRSSVPRACRSGSHID